LQRLKIVFCVLLIRVDLQCPLEMSFRFGIPSNLGERRAKIGFCIGIVRLQFDHDAELLSRPFHISHLSEGDAQVVVSLGLVGARCNRQIQNCGRWPGPSGREQRSS